MIARCKTYLADFLPFHFYSIFPIFLSPPLSLCNQKLLFHFPFFHLFPTARSSRSSSSSVALTNPSIAFFSLSPLTLTLFFSSPSSPVHSMAKASILKSYKLIVERAFRSSSSKRRRRRRRSTFSLALSLIPLLFFHPFFPFLSPFFWVV